jgi:hypothetical protein
MTVTFTRELLFLKKKNARKEKMQKKTEFFYGNFFLHIVYFETFRHFRLLFCLSHYATSPKVRFPMRSLYVSVDLILLAAPWPWGSTQPLSEMSTKNFPGFKGRPVLKADNLTDICEPI